MSVVKGLARNKGAAVEISIRGRMITTTFTVAASTLAQWQQHPSVGRQVVRRHQLGASWCDLVSFDQGALVHAIEMAPLRLWVQRIDDDPMFTRIPIRDDVRLYAA